MDFPVVEQNITLKLSEKYKYCKLAKKTNWQTNQHQIPPLCRHFSRLGTDGWRDTPSCSRKGKPLRLLSSLTPSYSQPSHHSPQKSGPSPQKTKIKTFAIRRWIIIGIKNRQEGPRCRLESHILKKMPPPPFWCDCSIFDPLLFHNHCS